MRLTRESFAELFGVHLPAAVPCAWVRGVCFVFVEGRAEVEELERLLGRRVLTANINANHYL
jgi:hypothetical protein